MGLVGILKNTHLPLVHGCFYTHKSQDRVKYIVVPIFIIAFFCERLHLSLVEIFTWPENSGDATLGIRRDEIWQAIKIQAILTKRFSIVARIEQGGSKIPVILLMSFERK